MLAADCGHSDVINLLLDHGAAIEAEDNVRLDAFCLVKHYFHQCRSPSNIVSSGSPRLCIPVEEAIENLFVYCYDEELR